MPKLFSHLSALALGIATLAAMPQAADAYWYRGYWRPGVVVVPPPVIYAPPPPVYYAPPPVTYVPPGFDDAPAVRPGPGASCAAGAAMCPMEVARPVGAACYCGTPGGRAYGTVR